MMRTHHNVAHIFHMQHLLNARWNGKHALMILQCPYNILWLKFDGRVLASHCTFTATLQALLGPMTVLSTATFTYEWLNPVV